MIKKCPRLISIIDITRYPMTSVEYRKALNMPGNSYVDACLRKLRNLGVFKIPAKARYGKVLVLTEAGEEIKKERCKESGKEYDYYKPDMKNSEYKAYSRVAGASRRRKIVRVMKDEYETFTQIYKRTDLRFEKVNDTLREFVKSGIALQEEARGRYKLNKKGIEIRDFIKKIDEIQKKQREGESKQENSSIYPV